MTDSPPAQPNPFLKFFVPGLVLGLILGALVGAFASGLEGLRSTPKVPEAGPRTQTPQTPRRDDRTSPNDQTPGQAPDGTQSPEQGTSPEQDKKPEQNGTGAAPGVTPPAEPK